MEKVEYTRGRVTAMPEAGPYGEICCALRRELDEEIAISQQLQVRRSRETVGRQV